MVHRLRTLLVLALLVLIDEKLAAQTCIGLPLASWNVSAAMKFPHGAKSFGARLGHSGDRAFAGASMLYESVDDSNAHAVGLGADGGLLLPYAPARAVRLCPIASLQYINGPSFDEGAFLARQSALQLGVGVAAGVAVELTPTLRVIPNLALSIAHTSSNVRVRYKSSTPGGFDEKTSESGGLVGAGVSLLFRDLVALQSTLSVPVGFENSDAQLGIVVTVAIPGKAKAR